MLDLLIRLALRHRAAVVLSSLVILFFGYRAAHELPVEVLPDLTKPTVTILTECPGLAPEEVEARITRPLENALMGVAGLTRMRSSSDVALSLVFAEFDWDTEIYHARQLVQERLQGVADELPEGVRPFLTPVTSLMGEILLIGVSSEEGRTAAMDVRSIADWDIATRLESIPGVAEVLSMGGGIKQIQVQPEPWRMRANGVSFEELEQAVQEAASNTTGGYIEKGSQEIMIRNLSMTTDLYELGKTVIKKSGGRQIAISDVAKVAWETEPMRGDAAVNGTPGVIMSVTKAPGFDTIELSEKIEAALADLQAGLPDDITTTVLFRQRDFIDGAMGNLTQAIVEGASMVVIILILFLLSVRTTFITLTAMPLSFAITLLTFKWFDLSVNSMTLGGLAVAIGMVVDDAIVDVENVFRRLKENANLSKPLPRLEVVARASSEIRNAVYYATLIIVLVFLPLLGLTGIEGRLFGPIAIATIVSMIASFIVSLTTIPVLCDLILKVKPSKNVGHTDSRFVRFLKLIITHSSLRLALRHPLPVLAGTSMLMTAAFFLYPKMGKDFLPQFHEQTIIVTTAAAPGTSRIEMQHLAKSVEKQIRAVPEVNHIGRRIGRAERSDHVMPISNVEFDIDFKKDASDRSTAEILDDIRHRVGTVPGTFSVLSGPLAHRISHLLSGVTAPIAIKIFGSDLDEIMDVGKRIQAIAHTIPGLESAKLDQQATIPQLRIEPDRARCLAHGVSPGELNAELATLLGGSTIAELLDNKRTIDLAIRLPEEWRDDLTKIRELPVHTKNGREIPLHLVADVREASGPSTVQRENMQRTYTVAITPSQHDAGELVRQLQEKVANELDLPAGVFLSYEGDFQAQRDATLRIAVLSLGVLFLIIFLLWSYFRNLNLALQVLINLPLALIGSLFLSYYLDGNISIATLVGFIAVGGIAARNGILLIAHYLHLMAHEGESFGDHLIIRGTLERFLPVTMTALAAGIALIPFVMARSEPGKEILSPVAICIVGGLFSATLLNFLVTPTLFKLFGKKAALRSVALKSPASH